MIVQVVQVVPCLKDTVIELLLFFVCVLLFLPH